jgi:hypothetical protein
MFSQGTNMLEEAVWLVKSQLETISYGRIIRFIGKKRRYLPEREGDYLP